MLPSTPLQAEVRTETLNKMIANPTVETTAPATTINATDSFEGRVANSEATQNETADGEEEESSTPTEAMKLVVRSPYWGRILKGKARRDYDDAGIPGRPYRLICCQAVLSAVEGQYWGCCPHHGKRVLELREYHFSDVYPGNWDLYMVGSSVTSSYTVHAFFLLPQSQTLIDVSYKIATQGWVYVGTANAQCVRMDLEGMLSDILKQNDGVGFRYHHVHLEILMDQVLDRETPRSRKAAIEKSRTERSSNSSVMTPLDYSSGEGSSSAATSTPPIPHTVSNEHASWYEASPSTYATSGATSTHTHHQHHHHHQHQHHPDGMMRGWNPAVAVHNFLPSSYTPAWTAHEQQQQHANWYPAAIVGQYPPQFHTHPHAAGMPHMLAPMNPAQQLLHQGYAMGTDTVLPSNPPSGYVASTAGTQDHIHARSGYAARDPYQQQRYLDSSASAYPSSFAPLSHLAMPEEEDRNDGDEAQDREKNEYQQADEKQADEKFCEDVATASVSETTAEEELDDHIVPSAGHHIAAAGPV